jgi:hypothetical protein
MIRDARKRILDLEYSIGVFEKRKAMGETCLAQPYGQTSESATQC